MRKVLGSYINCWELSRTVLDFHVTLRHDEPYVVVGVADRRESWGVNTIVTIVCQLGLVNCYASHIVEDKDRARSYKRAKRVSHKGVKVRA